MTKTKGMMTVSDDDKLTDRLPVTNDGNAVELSSTVGVKK